MEVCKGK